MKTGELVSGSGRGLAFLAGLALLLGFVGAVELGGTGVARPGDPGSAASLAETAEAGAGLAVPGPTEAGSATGAAAGATDGVVPARPGLECAAGRNGGATDRGVEDGRIRVASTVVLDGPAASLLSASALGMRAVIDKVNRAGGVCGRLVDLTLVNDGFDAQRGQQFLRNFIEQGYFALPVVPSAEGLSAAITSRDIGRAGIPVVGSDGMRIEQYRDPWVWPVATATMSTMRIMARHGHAAHGARTFAIVWDSKYKFGVEGAEAFRAQVKAMGGTLVADVPLDPDRPNYASEAQAFNERCRDNACDMVAMLLLPDAARTWIAARPVSAAKHTAAAQTLFTDRFAQDCVQVAKLFCHGIFIWTGYNPPIGAEMSRPGVAEFVNDVQSLDPAVDVRNQFLQGAYLGMNVFVEALRATGPDLTRDRLRGVLDSFDYTTDLAPELAWRPDRHHANASARAYSIVVARDTFSGWRDEGTGFVRDPAHGG